MYFFGVARLSYNIIFYIINKFPLKFGKLLLTSKQLRIQWIHPTMYTNQSNIAHDWKLDNLLVAWYSNIWSPRPRPLENLNGRIARGKSKL